MHSLPPKRSTAFAARATSPSVQVHSCRAFSRRASALRRPAPTALYGGLQATRSSTGSGKTARMLRMSPLRIVTLPSSPFSSTDACACRSASASSSTPVTARGAYRACQSSGIVPQPVPRSAQRSHFFGAAKCASRIVSVVKRCARLTSTRQSGESGSQCSPSRMADPPCSQNRRKRPHGFPAGRKPAETKKELPPERVSPFLILQTITPAPERKQGTYRRMHRTRCRSPRRLHTCLRPRRSR